MCKIPSNARKFMVGFCDDDHSRRIKTADHPTAGGLLRPRWLTLQTQLGEQGGHSPIDVRVADNRASPFPVGFSGPFVGGVHTHF